jgi:hypothetical protein
MNGFDKLNYSRLVSQQLLVTSIPQEQIIIVLGKSLDKFNGRLKTLSSLEMGCIQNKFETFYLPHSLLMLSSLMQAE